MSKKELIAAVEGRYADWYGSGDEYTTECTAGDWSLRDAGETLSHAIVREDVPELLLALAEQAATIEALTTRLDDEREWWINTREDHAEHLMIFRSASLRRLTYTDAREGITDAAI